MEGSKEGAEECRGRQRRAGGKQRRAGGGRGEQRGSRGGRTGEKEPSHSAAAFFPLPASSSPAAMSCVQGRGYWARLRNLSVLSEMSAEINLADPPRWPVTLISPKFQAD